MLNKRNHIFDRGRTWSLFQPVWCIFVATMAWPTSTSQRTGQSLLSSASAITGAYLLLRLSFVINHHTRSPETIARDMTTRAGMAGDGDFDAGWPPWGAPLAVGFPEEPPFSVLGVSVVINSRRIRPEVT